MDLEGPLQKHVIIGCSMYGTFIPISNSFVHSNSNHSTVYIYIYTYIQHIVM